MCRTVFAMFMAILAFAASANDDAPEVAFMGPLLTPDAETLPRGSVNVQAFLIYEGIRGSYGEHGDRHRQDAWRSRPTASIPVQAGLSRRLQFQLTPSAIRDGTEGWRTGDTALTLQYMAIAPVSSGVPAIAIAYTRNLPTGKYDQLGINGGGSGTGISLQTYAVLIRQEPNPWGGHPWRWYAQLSWSPSPARVALDGRSVYDTPSSFHGRMDTGRSMGASTAFELSLHRHWAVTMELAWNHQRGNRLRGTYTEPGPHAASITRAVPSSWTYSIAPAIEYLVHDGLSLMAGVHLSVAGHRSDAFASPQIAMTVAF